jgi:hypothetical protein
MVICWIIQHICCVGRGVKSVQDHLQLKRSYEEEYCPLEEIVQNMLLLDHIWSIFFQNFDQFSISL